ncbi:MAG: MATE family efflux transporter, partial [Planctomycetaceae bacterium]
MLHFTVMSVALGLVTYVNTFVAQYEGAQRPDRVAASVWQGVYVAVFSGLALTACIPLAEMIFRSVGHAQAVQQLEVEYFSVLCWGCVPLLLSAVLSSFYSGRGRTRVVMVVNLATVGMNGVLDYCLIFGWGDIPALGMAGAAWATVCSKVIACVWFIGLMLRSEERQSYRVWHYCQFDRELFGRLIRHGMPNGLQFLADILGFTLFLFLLGGLGVQQLAASNLAFNINSLGYIPMMGMGTAVMTLVGQRVGAGTPQLAVRTTWTAFWISGSYTLAFALVCVTLPDVVLYPYAYSSDPEQFAVVRGTVHVLLRYVAVFVFFDAMAIVFSSAVRGAGDTRFSLIFTSLTC